MCLHVHVYMYFKNVHLSGICTLVICVYYAYVQEERSKVDDLRGTPMAVGTLEEVIDDNHVIVSTSVGSEYYVNILSFVDNDLIEPGCTVLLHNKVSLCSRTTADTSPSAVPCHCTQSDHTIPDLHAY